jgi:MFS family permease
MWASALCATLITQVASAFAAAAIPLLGPLLTLRWGLAPESIGYVAAVVSVGICWFLACGNPMLDHFGPIRALQIGLASAAAGLLLLSQPFGIIGLAGALLVGLGVAPNTPAGSQILMRTAPPAHRTLVFSIKQAGVPLGGAIAGFTVAPMVLALGFTGGVWALAALVLASAAVVEPFRARLDVEKGARNPAWARMFLSPSSLARSARVLGSHASLPMLAALGVSLSMTQACVTAFTATYMVTQHGKTLAQAGQLVATLLVASTFSRIFLGWLADRLGGGRRLLCVLGPAAGAAIALMVGTAGTIPWLLYPCMALVGATAMGWNGVFMAELARASPPALTGDVTSSANLFGFVGSICGPLLFAVLARKTGSFDWPFLLVAGQVAASGALALWYLLCRRRRG